MTQWKSFHSKYEHMPPYKKTMYLDSPPLSRYILIDIVLPEIDAQKENSEPDPMGNNNDMPITS